MSTNDDSGRKDAGLPSDFEQKARHRFDEITKPEVTFPQYLEQQKGEARRQAALAANAARAYQPSVGTATPCGNGDFDTSLDPAEWQGAYGAFPTPPTTATSPGQTINFATLTSGISSGPVTLGSSHQTWVSAGFDPTLSPAVNLPTTAQGSAGAVRIGNAFPGQGCELLGKTFLVNAGRSTITFWYAVVLQNPAAHPYYAQPFFWVRVTDAIGNPVPNAFDFGSGSDKLVADSTNPFFQSTTVGGERIVYKDWSCAQIDLSTQVGKVVTVEFVTADCGFGAHWGYAYIDSFCGNCKGSPTGDLTYDCESSTHCGDGRICFNYELPKIATTGAVITGSVTITLNIYQNGVPVAQLTSPVLTSGSSYCFNVSPSSIPGINPALGGFDFVATGAFAITTGSTTTQLGHMTVGTVPDGVSQGQNNGYAIACRSCSDIEHEQDAYLSKRCATKFNLLPRVSCRCPDAAPTAGDCRCDCKAVSLPDLQPCISVAWGDSKCDCMETDDVEIMCISVCNCYSNVTFNDLTIGQIRITDMAGNPVPVLPDGTPSVQVVPSGPICFGDVGPCQGRNRPTCVSRELLVYTRGAVGKDYRLSFEGVCFSVTHSFQSEQCFVLTLCQD